MQRLRNDKDALPAAVGNDEASAALEDAPAPEPVSQAVLALLDVVEGARASYLWGLLGWQDIRQRYRRSEIGPFWLTISMGVMVGAIGMLYAGLFKIEVADYLPFIALGFIVWGLISGLITDGCA
ncbi:MAG: ABC transporter permease, partial [Proteobacteria bacterium]|nr:ABC transporter permease [Pseudomonadota bacterium]